MSTAPHDPVAAWRGAVAQQEARAEAAEAERDRLAAEVETLRARLAAVAQVAWHLKSAHIRVGIETNIADDYERGQQHAQDDAYRRLRAALAGGPDA